MLSHGGAVRRGQGVDDRIVVVKIGGSLMGKEPEFSYRAEAVAPVARAIARSGVKVVVVHGGGAFGHPVAKRYGLSSSSTSRSSRGVSETRRAMFDLNIRVCDSLMAEGLRPYAFSPFPLLASAGRRGEAWLRWLLSESLTPVTFGDVVRDGEGFRVLSGDSIARQLSTLLRGALRLRGGRRGRHGAPRAPEHHRREDPRRAGVRGVPRRDRRDAAEAEGGARDCQRRDRGRDRLRSQTCRILQSLKGSQLSRHHSRGSFP